MGVTLAIGEWVDPTSRYEAHTHHLLSHNGGRVQASWDAAWDDLDSILAALARHYGWHVFDARGLTRAFRRQDINL